MSDRKYHGWANYETWAVKLWMDNNEGDYLHWQDRTRDAWDNTDDKYPNQYMSHDDNARNVLATELKDFHDDQSEHPVFKAADGTVYSDLLNAALSEVDWRDIADSLLNDLRENDETVTYQAAR